MVQIHSKEATKWADITGSALHTLLVGSDGLTPLGATGQALDVNIKSGSVLLNAGDIEIGAVEIKDNDSDTRVEITSKNAIVAQTFPYLGQPVSGSILLNWLGGSILSTTIEYDGLNTQVGSYTFDGNNLTKVVVSSV